MRGYLKSVKYMAMIACVYVCFQAPCHAVPQSHVTYEYDELGRIIKTIYLNGNYILTTYQGDTNFRLQNQYYLSGDEWVWTMEFYPNSRCTHYIWVIDYNPSVSGDTVFYRYDLQGRVERQDLDNGWRIYADYWSGTSSKKKQDRYFDASLVWQKTIEYYSNGKVQHYMWVRDADPSSDGDEIYYRYDNKGRVERTDLDTGARVHTYYWDGNTDIVKERQYFDPSLAWQKTTRYWDDGVTIHYQWLKDQNPSESGDVIFEQYDHNGVVVEKRYDDGSIWRVAPPAPEALFMAPQPQSSPVPVVPHLGQEPVPFVAH